MVVTIKNFISILQFLLYFKLLTTSISTVKQGKSFFVNLIFIRNTVSLTGLRAVAKWFGSIDNNILLCCSSTPDIVYCENSVFLELSHHKYGVRLVISSFTRKQILSGSIISAHSFVIFANIRAKSK